MIGIYLASYKASHPNYNIKYQDINGLRDIGGDMLEINLEPYDFIIATPPCNYYSRGNYRRDKSEYSLKTKHLLPSILRKLCYQEKPFIVENVRNYKKYKELGLFNLPCFIYFIGRHTYRTNIMIMQDIEQELENIQHITQKNREGGQNVHYVIEEWLKNINNKEL